MITLIMSVFAFVLTAWMLTEVIISGAGIEEVFDDYKGVLSIAIVMMTMIAGLWNACSTLGILKGLAWCLGLAVAWIVTVQFLKKLDWYKDNFI